VEAALHHDGADAGKGAQVRGQVLLPADAPWLATYLQELLGFPTARHDDQVDSTSQALAWLTTRRNQGTSTPRPNPQRPLGPRA
jgi:hypothetical protein